MAAAQDRGSLLSAGCEVPAGVTDEAFAAFCDAPLSSVTGTQS